MKNFERLFVMAFIAMLNLVSFAQDTTAISNTKTTTVGEWYAQPWMWVVGAAIFILLLVALMRGNRRD